MEISNIEISDYKLNNLGKINIILGKNGCGKSTLLKKFEESLRSTGKYGKIKYITPERGGVLKYNPSVDNNMLNDTRWLENSRRRNRFENFREQTMAQFRKLEILFYREKEADNVLSKDSSHKFAQYFNKINELLDNIEVKPYEDTFRIFKKGTEQEIAPDLISSGESELISLGIESLVFQKEATVERVNILFLDEPDVHLHPDLQERLSIFLRELVSRGNIIIIIATHSTAFISALEDYEDTCIEFMVSGQTKLDFKKISDEYRKILPVFGAHPLSNLFNQTPIFLVEGEDDERIWQHAVRSSNKKLKIYPCSTDGVDNMPRYENEVEQIIKSIYDNAKAFSLRDKDESAGEISNLNVIKRFKLSCRASENLLLTDEVLNTLGATWSEVEKLISNWLTFNPSHCHFKEISEFESDGFDRKNYDLKDIRNDLMHIIGKSIAWEMAIGKTIGKLIFEEKIISTSEHSICSYLGEKLVNSLLELSKISKAF